MPNVQFKLVPVDYNRNYDEQTDCTRHVIGAYSNLARHNLTVVINSIMQSLGLDTFNENEIGNAFSSSHRKQLSKLDNIQKVYLQKRLYRHFTFLKRWNLEDEKKKSTQLDKLLNVLSSFTSCMADIRNYYTHYNPYNSSNELEKQKQRKLEMGKNLTHLFENSCQALKKRESLTHELNEVFNSQRERVQYTYFWYLEKELPNNMTLEELRSVLRNEPGKKRTYNNILYRLNSDDTVTGICRSNGQRKRYTWNDTDKRFPDIKYSEYHAKLEQLQSENKKKEGKNVYFELIGEKGIKLTWSQFDRDPDYYASMYDEEKGLSDVGILYFLCLFLEKSVAFEMMEEVGFTTQCTFTASNEGENLDMLQEIMCMNRIRMVKSKLDSEMTDTALALDMLNEVRKCPKPLYKVLGVKARDEFKDENTAQWELEHQREAVATEDAEETEREDSAFESVTDDSSDNTEKNTPKSTFVRWDDRFSQLALSYIDMMGLFADIRFQLNLGKYRFAFYRHDTKYSVDNVERLRTLQKELHGFGRIQEVPEKIKEKWGAILEKRVEIDGVLQKTPDQEGQAPYVTDQRPFYAIDNKSHSIGMRWEGWRAPGATRHYGDLDAAKLFIPNLPVTPSQNDENGKQKNNAEKLLPPQCTMSLYELPALLFYQYLLSKHGDDKFKAEQRIKDYYTHLHSFLTAVKDGKFVKVNGETEESLALRLNEAPYQLKLSDIPDRIKKYLLSAHNDNEQKLQLSAKIRLEERQKRLLNILSSHRDKKKRIGTKDNKFDSMRATIKTGNMAQTIMRDIMEWMPADCSARNKLSGQSYMALQAALTMLGQSFGSNENEATTLDDLWDMMVKGGVINTTQENNNSSYYHPFLHLVFKDCKDTNPVEYIIPYSHMALQDCPPGTIERFYEAYLEREIKYIANILSDIDRGINRCRYIPFMHHERPRWKKADDEAIRTLAAEYLNKPLQLPTGIFTKPIFDYLRNDIQQGNVPQEKWQEYKNGIDNAEDNGLSLNASYLIGLYFRCIEKDHSQPFYSTEPVDGAPSPYLHIYKVFKKYYGKPIPETNRKETPEYTVEEVRNHLKNKIDIQQKIDSYVANEVEKYRQQKQKAFDRRMNKYRDQLWESQKQQAKKENRRWDNDEIKQYVDKAINIEKQKFNAAITQYAVDLRKKQERMFRKVNDNERAIRRFKTQDILMFIMAREILRSKNPDISPDSGFKLKFVMTDNLLNTPVDFTWKVKLRDSNNDEHYKTIEQKDMKLKDYGQFYKFASDHQRLASLLLRLPEDSFLRSHIENELSHYDTNRSEVFRQVYIIESEAYKLKPELKDDTNASEDWFWYTDNKGKKHPKRNSFKELLTILAAGNDGILNEDEKQTLRTTRNAFGHNTYDVDLPVIFKGKESHMRIPEVADGIKSCVEQQTAKLKENLDK